MALPTSGTISMDAIRAELGIPAQAPFGLDQARQGVYVPINSCSANKPPASGAVSLASWYGYNHTATCSCAVTYNINMPTSTDNKYQSVKTTTPIVLSSPGNVDVTLTFTLVVPSSLYTAGLSFYAEYWNGSTWISYGFEYDASKNSFFNSYGVGTHTVTLNYRVGSYPGYNTMRFVIALDNYNPFGATPPYFSSIPQIYIACPTLDTCGSSLTFDQVSSTLTTTAIRWISLGGYVTGTVSIPWSFVMYSGSFSIGFRVIVWYNGSIVADTGFMTNYSTTPQTGTLTFSVNGADDKYAIACYDPNFY